MSKTIIKVENLGKKYQIGSREPYYSLRDTIVNFFDFKKKHTNNEFWALKDINFEVKQGESVGIIGRNGAGKSTLLKILSQITPPTTGKVTMHGRVASLLEVGTGFNLELTGRENIFLNGAILGMTREEIRRKFDEIVAFSEIEKFLDTPVKRYSSGMYMRLAFAVAAHLESEILIVDEVLAVGDAEFQKKCLGKMDDVAKKEGRTVLFVSHNMEAVRKLCGKGILLSEGELKYEGNVEKTLRCYKDLQTNGELKTNRGEYNTFRRGSGTLSFTKIEILDTNGRKRNAFKNNEKVRFSLSYQTFSRMIGLHVRICIFSTKVSGLLLSDIWADINNGEVKEGEKDSLVVEVDLSSLRAGEYALYFWIGDTQAIVQALPTNYDVVENMTKNLVIESTTTDDDKYGGYFSLPVKVISR